MNNASLLKSHWKGVTFILLVLLTIIACKKDENVKFETDLALNANIVRVADTLGTTRIQVYAKGPWKVSTEDNVDWVSFDKTSGSGKGEFFALVKSNEGQLPRSVKLLISSDKKTDTIVLQQKGFMPFIKFADESSIGMGKEAEMKTVISTNIPLELMKQHIHYDELEDWISGLSIEEGYLKFHLSKNELSTERNATIELSFLDAFGHTTISSILVHQNPKAEYDNAVLKNFSYVKNSMMVGLIQEDVYIEGIVVSDKGNPNMGLNSNNSSNKHQIDKSENAITVYIQSLDGRSGFHIRTRSAGDNIFNKNEKVNLWLKGVTLLKENSPNRTILEDVSVLNIISKTQSEAVIPRDKYIKDLTDNDLYTLVKLNDVEISVPSGSFTNINEGYNLRTDAYPTNIRDKNGNSLYLITNLSVPYRRDGNQVPQGSGDITGILIHEKLSRYGGDIGKYSIRPITREDINLNDSRENGFSNVLVEWNQFRNEYITNPNIVNNPLTPSIGSGTLTRSNKSLLDFKNATTGIISQPDYNGLLIQATTVKGIVSNGAWSSNNWWDSSKNRGEWWKIKVSTLGITNPISLQIEGNNEIGGPRNFVVEWSATGGENDSWNEVGEYTLQDVVNWGNTLLTQVPGFKVNDFQFPLSASNLQNLFIRLRAKDNVAGGQTSSTGSAILAPSKSYLGHISIKYNK